MDTKTKNKIEELAKKEEDARRERVALEEAEIERVQKPYLKSLVGSCWMYPKNSYSVPQKSSDYWDVYRKILDAVDTDERGFHFIFEEFSTDRDGKTVLAVENRSAYLNKEWHKKPPFPGFVKITEEEYELAKTAAIREMGTQKKMRKILNTKW